MTTGDQEAPAKEELKVVLHGEETGGGLIALKSLDIGDFLLASLNLAASHYQGSQSTSVRQSGTP